MCVCVGACVCTNRNSWRKEVEVSMIFGRIFRMIICRDVQDIIEMTVPESQPALQRSIKPTTVKLSITSPVRCANNRYNFDSILTPLGCN